MENNADFVALWLGLSKLGIISAWINSHLKLEPLAHSIRTAKSNAIVTTSSLLPNVPAGVFPIRDEVLRRASDEPKAPPLLNFRSVLCYIYTSGTTGNPKPAVIKHFRFYWMAMGCGKSFGVLPDDCMYITLPMYHSAAGIVGIGQTLIQGCTAVVRKKFSASNFWKDCLKYECTVSQYVGELCRYLLAQKEIPEEKLHKVRLMYGNGLRAEIWPDFVNRFNITKIGELYGSTEGNSNIVNIDNRVGACGFFPIYPFIAPVYPVRLLKIDEETGEVLRGKDGLCIPCRPGETGEMVGVIKDSDILLRFEGYVSSEETSKKIIRNALRPGDAVFSSGDVIYWDELGYLYFKDRRGDTFRWKGENVSTTEVEGILQPLKTLASVTVYGVEVPKKEGRAGMAAVVPHNGVPHEQLLQEIATRLSQSLPVYAIPLFLRFCEEADITGTFKLRKVNLRREGFSLERCHNDPVYYWDSSSATYK
ncbi:unnamed protein product [Toxocara canis]|uniref:long-chain-fatty-acid--CoA ligase n=1 Tax=Toxocara canis TaxID=6265 RepID=A0A183TXZ3_TOXCA|nr:unnamed protein product [Toxocara canis]